jgi:hypothetical protein
MENIEGLYFDLISDCKIIKKQLLLSDIDEDEVVGSVRILDKHIKKYNNLKWEMDRKHEIP